MNLTEKYPRIKPEAIKPVRHHTDWGTRLMFHPDLFPKYKGTRYDVLDETDTLHTGVLWEGDSFQAPFPQRHPIIKAWSPSTVVIHGYELNEFYKWCEQFIKANSTNLIGTLTDALTAFHAYKHRSSRSDLLAALNKIEHRTEAKEALYESLCNNGETLKTYTGDANKLFNDILNAYKDILVGNIYCLEMGKYLHVTDVFGKWVVASDGDAGIYLKCKRLTYQAFGNASAYPCCENTEMCFTMSVCELAKKVAAGGDPVGVYAKPVSESTVTAELDKMEKAFTTNMKTVREYVANVYGRKEA